MQASEEVYTVRIELPPGKVFGPSSDLDALLQECEEYIAGDAELRRGARRGDFAVVVYYGTGEEQTSEPVSVGRDDRLYLEMP